MKPLLLALLFTLNAPGRPAGHWSFDGATDGERLRASYGETALDATEADGSSSWADRDGFGQVLANGGNLSYLSLPNSPAIAPGTGDFSLSLWLRRTSGDGSVAGILDALDGVDTGFQLFYLNNTIRIRLDDSDGNVSLVDTTTPQFFLNQWLHLAVLVDRQTKVARILVNGSEVTPDGGVSIANLTGSLTPNQDWWVGRLNNDNPALGQIDDFAVFRRLLTPDELNQLAAGTPVLSLFPPTPLLPTISFTPESGVIEASSTVTLSAEGFDEIRYTLDGSEPDQSSPLYTGALPVPASTEIRARGFLDDAPGPLSSARYVVVPVERPNLLMIVADDLGFNDLGCYGAVSVLTPHLDRLAAEGLRFTQFTTTGPGDLACQHALLTGRVAARAALPPSLTPGEIGLDPREWTLAESLRKQGYHTALVGSWNLGTLAESRPRSAGFALFHGLPYPLDQNPPLVENGTTVEASSEPEALFDQLTERADQFLAAQSPDHPFLLCFQPPSLPASGNSYLGSYGNRVEALDGAVGRLLDTLEARDLAQSTLVVFLSDSGADRSSGVFPGGSNGQLKDGKGTTWEGGLRTPLIVKWPGVIAAGQDSRALLSLADLAPSLMEVCRTFAPSDRSLDGVPEASRLLGVTTDPHPGKTLFTYRFHETEWQAATVRSGPWKLHLTTINSDPGNTTTASPPLLYQVEEDPSERIRRESNQPALVNDLNTLAALRQDEVNNDLLPPALPPLPDQPLLVLSGEENPSLSFVRPTESLNDFYTLERSTNLVAWDPFPINSFVVDSALQEGGLERVTLSLPAEFLSPASSFLRIKFQPHP